MDTSQERLQKDIEILARFNATPGNGVTRFSYSAEDARARGYLREQMDAIGLHVSIDGVGNMRGRLAGTNPDLPVILIGSHIDTVRHGGRFDGVVGVVAGLEVARVLRENNLVLNHPVDLVVFAEEEGSNFGLATAGSKALVGHIGVADIERMRDASGTSAFRLMQSFGLAPGRVGDSPLRGRDVRAMLELHIEQSYVLDRTNIPIGIVTGISGIQGYRITFHGESNHAGATPMQGRRDPMTAAAGTIASINPTVGKWGGPDTVATVGRIECHPNVMNVIPERVSFTVDIRDPRDSAMDAVSKAVLAMAEHQAAASGVGLECELISGSRGVELSGTIIGILDEILRERGIACRHMVSGAVHDAAIMATIAETGMVFIPCRDGRSHCPDEHANIEHIKRGTDILIEAVVRIDRA